MSAGKGAWERILPARPAPGVEARRAMKRLVRVLALAAALGSVPGLAFQAVAQRVPGPFEPLLIYPGTWNVTAAHPWSGAAPGAVDRLSSQCETFKAFFACEQSVNGKPLALIVFTAGDREGEYHTRTIGPNGLAGGRGTMRIDGNRWTYLDKPSAGLSGPWSRVENVILSPDRIAFEEYESHDEGKSWSLTNNGVEDRVGKGRADPHRGQVSRHRTIPPGSKTG